MNHPPLVLSLFPGIGLLDRAFEVEGFTVVRGPDVLWGGDIREFHPPAGRFEGIIGGPPCQSHSAYAPLVRSRGHKVAEDLVPEFLRVVAEASPDWWLMENSPGVPEVGVIGYITHAFTLDARWFGMEQSRVRKWQFGTPSGQRIWPETIALQCPRKQSACLASEGKAGKTSTKRIDGKPTTVYEPRRSPTEFCELQGLPADFMDGLPFTNEWKYRVVGNGVPLPMGRAVARAVKETIGMEASA